jgi:hypothetical protein
MTKVRILDRSEFCDGEAYILECGDIDLRGETSAMGTSPGIAKSDSPWAGRFIVEILLKSEQRPL